MQSLIEIFSPGGALSRQVEGFSARREQLEMAQAVYQAVENDQLLIAEAGTGTGKTFAYLVPAMLSGQKVIISTGTKNLQDQLYFRDIPTARRALESSISTALLKGRANYLCVYHLQQVATDGRLSDQEIDKIASIQYWAGTTKSGDLSDCSDLSEQDDIWSRVTSTTDNCLGTDCPDISACYVLKARKIAQEADLLVVNHHLFFADMALRDDGFGEVLPGANTVIFDEAHQLPAVASNFFGVSLTSRQLIEFSHDAQKEMLRDAADQTGIIDLTCRLEKAIGDLRLGLGDSGQRSAWDIERSQNTLQKVVDALKTALADLGTLLHDNAERGTGIERCRQRADDLLGRLELFNSLDKSTGPEPTEDDILWYETYRKGFALHRTPVSIAEIFHAHISKQRRTWIFTSATLAVAKRFNHFKKEMGIESAVEAYWESPFDFSRQALLYLPRDLPDPNAPGYIHAAIDAALPLIEASGGRTFFLVTSYRALKEVAARLETEIDYPVLVQGSKPRDELLALFRSLGNAVLVGTNSFWEGVDVRGGALSCVIIDKLPFAVPDDPVLQARFEVMRKRCENPFFDYQLPKAVISLKQGVGRLIRDASDCGVLMLCDPRLLNKSYGRVFLNSLPVMGRTRDLDTAMAFFDIPH